MTGIWAQMALVFGLALIATLVSNKLRISTALSEIIVGMLARAIFSVTVGVEIFGVQEPWVKTLAGVGAILLTFLAGAELDPDVFKAKWKESVSIGVASFLLPAVGCWAAAHYFLGWETMPAILAGIALAATSVAVVYTVMMEYGLNRTDFGKTILAACFVTDLGTVVTLGLVFAPFTFKTALFVVVVAAAFIGLPRVTPYLFKLFGGRPSEFEAKLLLFCLLGMGALATWADSEAVLPAYLIGMTLAGANPPPPHHRHRTADALLLHKGRLFRIDRGRHFGANRRRYPAGRRGRDQGRQRLSRGESLWIAAQGRDVHHFDHGLRSDLRHHRLAVRPVSQDHRREPVFDIGGGHHRHGDHSDGDRQQLLPASPPAAEGLG
jgi:predicted Kef-type K+ transport protein